MNKIGTLRADRVHCFLRGWLRLYGGEYIPERLWWKIRLAGL
jgi:hypothetical protein